MAHVRSLFFQGAASESENKALEAVRLGRPSSVIWNITNRCNLLCNHCYMAADTHELPDQLSDDECMDLVDRFDEAGVPVVFLSGGEPMMRPNFWEILERVHASGVRPTISTNCTLVNEKTAQRLAENGVRWVATSMYGPEEFHDKMVGIPGTHKKVVEAIKTLRKHNVGVVLKTALTKETWEYIFDIIQMCKDLDCGMIYICDLITSGRSEGEEDLRVTNEQWRELCDFIVEDMQNPESKLDYDIGAIPSIIPYIAEKFIEKGIDVSKGLERLKLFSACPVGKGHMTINSEGDVMACQFAQDWTFGNVRDISIAEATRRLGEINEAESEGQCAPANCDYSAICRGCRVKAWQRTHNPMAEDISCILEPGVERTIPVFGAKSESKGAPMCAGSC